MEVVSYFLSTPRALICHFGVLYHDTMIQCILKAPSIFQASRHGLEIIYSSGI